MFGYHFSRRLLDDTTGTLLPHFDTVQGADYHCDYKSKRTQQDTYTKQGGTQITLLVMQLCAIQLPGGPTTPECPLQSIFFLKYAGGEKVQDRSQASETKSQAKSQAQLFVLKPGGCDAVLHNW